MEAATLSIQGCNPSYPGCNPMYRRTSCAACRWKRRAAIGSCRTRPAPVRVRGEGQGNVPEAAGSPRQAGAHVPQPPGASSRL
eukprot:scaffold74739_cov34-Phaeocystis_antarctica.AAC.1